jgi:hypothetical protein
MDSVRPGIVGVSPRDYVLRRRIEAAEVMSTARTVHDQVNQSIARCRRPPPRASVFVGYTRLNQWAAKTFDL